MKNRKFYYTSVTNLKHVCNTSIDNSMTVTTKDALKREDTRALKHPNDVREVELFEVTFKSLGKFVQQKSVTTWKRVKK